VGEVFPLTDTANGKAILALLDDAEVLRLAAAELGTGTRSVRMKTLLAEVQAVRERGYALDLDEHTSGISAVGIAFRDQRGDCHAISIPVPSSRFTIARQRLTTALLGAAAEVNRILGL
jgi:DNA-binding IclR family transcriptional regulator